MSAVIGPVREEIYKNTITLFHSGNLKRVKCECPKCFLFTTDKGKKVYMEWRDFARYVKSHISYYWS